MALEPAIAIHGGAGTIPAAALDVRIAHEYHAGMRQALNAGWRILANGGRALDAVTEAVVRLEDNPLFNVAHGAVFTAGEPIEMDAAIMSGRDRDVGAVAGIYGPRNPILAARAVMEKSGVVLMAGQTAEDFLRGQGFEFMPPEYFITRLQIDTMQLELARRGAGNTHAMPGAERHGTVGAVARDGFGDLAAATSTGGITGKRPSRLGDTPFIGAGTYADNATCAVSATGTCEVFTRFAAASEIAARLRHGGQSLEQAARDVVAELLAAGGDGGVIAIAANGLPVMTFNSAGMYRGFIGPDGVAYTAIHREAFQ